MSAVLQTDRQGRGLLLCTGGNSLLGTDPAWRVNLSMDGISGKIVFAAGQPGLFDLWRFNLVSGELARLTSGQYTAANSPKWSPDGRKIAFIWNQTGSPQLWIMNEDGSERYMLTEDHGYHGSPAWSCDGVYIYYCGRVEDPAQLGIWRIKYDGGEAPELMTLLAGMPTDICVLPGDKGLLYSGPQNGSYLIWELDLNSYEKIQITHGHQQDFSPTVSPDGRRILFVSSRGIKSCRDPEYSLWIMERDGSNLRRVSEQRGDDKHVTWAPDGKTCCFCTRSSNFSRRTMRIFDIHNENGYEDGQPDSNGRNGTREILGLLTSETSSADAVPAVSDYLPGSERSPHWV